MTRDLDHQQVVIEAVESALQAARMLAGMEFAAEAERTAAARAYWLAVERALDATIFATRSGFGIPASVLLLFGSLRDFAGELAVGNIPEPMFHVRARGTRAIGPTERRHILRAVTYRAAASDGVIDDPSPTRTVAEMFGVDESTAKGWFRRYRPFPVTTANEVRMLAEEAGRLYQSAGRSNTAKLNRNSKRQGGAK